MDFLGKIDSIYKNIRDQFEGADDAFGCYIEVEPIDQKTTLSFIIKKREKSMLLIVDGKQRVHMSDLQIIDGIFYGKLKQMALSNIIYTRYADDLTVSFKTDCTVKLPDIESLIASTADLILKRYSLHLKRRKEKICKLDFPVITTIFLNMSLFK